MSCGVAARWLASLMLLVMSTMFAGPFTGSAHGEPPDNPPDVASTSLPWPALGLPSSTDLYGDGARSFTVPIPAGLTPARLQGMIHTPLNIAAGYVEIKDGNGKFLGSVDLPPEAPGVAMVPFDIDISSARVRASSVDVSFTLRPRDTGDRYCGPVQRAELSDLVTVFVGTRLSASTIANFFPPVLGKVSIYVPIDAKPAEQQAALTLVSALARLAAPRPLFTEVVSQPRGAVPPPTAGQDRAIVVETGRPGLSIENPGTPGVYLRVSGEGAGLSDQVSLIATQLQPMAQASTARVDQAGSDAVLSGNTLTFSQLNIGGQTSFFRTNNLNVGVERSSLGARFNSIQVHLLADYTPVRSRDAATLAIKSNDLIVYRTVLNDSGRVDATFTLDGPVLDQQWINLEFDLTFTPDQPCGPWVAPLTFQIDPRSTLSMDRGGPPLNGFGAFPSEFSPKFLVAFDGSSPNQLSYAARVVAAIARLAKVQLAPEVVDLQRAASANSGALIVANSKAINQTPLTPPVNGDGSMINFALPTELQVNIDKGLGSIQAFADPPRNRSVVVVTTTADWSLVEPVFSYIDGLGGDWAQLKGDVLAAGAAGIPANVAIRQNAPVFEPPQSGTKGLWLRAGIGAGLLAAVAIIAGALYFGRRRTRQHQEEVTARSADD